MSGDPADIVGDGKVLATFNSQGGSLVYHQPLDQNSHITEPEDPVKPGYSFSGWYTTETCLPGTGWDFMSDTINEDLTLYAKWTSVSVSGLSEFYLINSPSASTNRLDIIYNRTYSGTISYIVSATDLGITNYTDYNESTATKTEVTITADTSGDPVYDDYIAITGRASNTKYYVYILDTDTNELKVLTRTTKISASRTTETGTITGYGGYIISYTISFPAWYDPDSSVTWPLIVSFKGSGITDPHFPCIVLTTDTQNSGDSSQVPFDVDKVGQKVTSLIENASYRIDKNRLYAWGFSLGGCAVLRIANHCFTDDYKFIAVVSNGCSDWIASTSYTWSYSGTTPYAWWVNNLGNTNIWICGGENDSYEPEVVHTKMPKTGGDHLLTLYPGLSHTSVPTFASPYTYLWLLSK